MNPSMNPYVFIVGCARSGTTLLARIADAHPELAITPETSWIAHWFEDRIGLTREGFVTPELPEYLRANPAFVKLGISNKEIEQLLSRDGPISYASFISALFDLYGEKRGKRCVGDKTPRFVRFLPTLHGLWPDAKVVHLIRDGRDVCLSALEWRRGIVRFSTWDDDPVATIALWWEWHLRLGREAAASLDPDTYMELHYESLVADPRSECEKLCAFLRLPYDEAMLRFHEGRMRARPHRTAKTGWLPVTAGLRKWTTEMSPDEVDRFEAVAGDLLGELGYPRASSSVSSARAARAQRLREGFIEDLRPAGRALPRAWDANGAPKP
jgi:hypothetical protein